MGLAWKHLGIIMGQDQLPGHPVLWFWQGCMCFYLFFFHSVSVVIFMNFDWNQHFLIIQDMTLDKLNGSGWSFHVVCLQGLALLKVTWWRLICIMLFPTWTFCTLKLKAGDALHPELTATTVTHLPSSYISHFFHFFLSSSKLFLGIPCVMMGLVQHRWQ